MSKLRDRLAAAQLPPAADRRRIRENAGASLREVGAELGVSSTSVIRWERGATPRSRKQAAAYARLLRELDELA